MRLSRLLPRNPANWRRKVNLTPTLAAVRWQCAGGSKIDFVRNGISGSAARYFVIILKFISHPISKSNVMKKISEVNLAGLCVFYKLLYKLFLVYLAQIQMSQLEKNLSVKSLVITVTLSMAQTKSNATKTRFNGQTTGQLVTLLQSIQP